MEQKTIGTVISVKKQWWLKVNTKPVRMHALDGATFPHIKKLAIWLMERSISKESGFAPVISLRQWVRK